MQVLNTIANNRFWNKHGVLIIWAFAGALLLLALIRIGWVSYSQARERAANYQPQAIQPLAQPRKKAYRVNDITSANLFGDSTPKPVVTKAPKTTLDLKLQGILSASNPETARAIITSGKKTTLVYSIGEAIKGAGASIKEIRDYEVLLDRNGATESLPLAQANTSGNRKIISFTNAGEDDYASLTASNNKSSRANRNVSSRQFSAANRSSSRRSRGTDGKPRKVRKPNFSGLDRALKKMGEL